MTPTRRELLRSGAALAGTLALPRIARADTALYAPSPGVWRTFEIVTRIEVAKPGRSMQAWLPIPAHADAAWIRPGANTWTTNAATAALARTGGDAPAGSPPALLHVAWKDGEQAPAVELTSRIETRDRGVDLGKRSDPATLDVAERARSLKATELLPTDGIVAETAGRITAGAGNDVDKVRALYAWVIENSHRDPKTVGCGLGDIATMLKSGNLGGKCADLNALFVGLARASGVPARDIYGLRVAPSRFGYKSLGPLKPDVTKAQHCRAEVFLDGVGWVPVDPADVRKVVLEEPPGQLQIGDAKVVAARTALLGSAEGNWLAFNTLHDVELPGSKGPRLAFLMYPQLEVDGVRIDCYTPDQFRYSITAREIST